MMTQATISDFCFNLKFSPPCFPNMAQTYPLLNSIGLQGIEKFKWVYGSYTPADDYLYLWQNIPPQDAPNFLILKCSTRLNMTVEQGGSWLLHAAPIVKSYFHVLPKGSPCIITGIYLEGRINVADPMPQGIPVDYVALFGQATIT